MESNYISRSYIWERRLYHGIRYQKGPVPFPESVEVGLDFNAGFERKEKLDLSLLTNGVMLELCEFAKTVHKSEMYFLFEMVDFNFDLGLDPDNKKLQFNYAARLHGRMKVVRDQIRGQKIQRSQVFALPGPAESTELRRSFCPKWSKMDISVLTKGSSGHLLETQQEDAAFMFRKPGGLKFKLTTQSYPCCLANGVTMRIPSDNTPRQKLDMDLLTNGVAVELFDFSKVLCGTQNQIVQDLVQQNFGHRLETLFFRLHISKLLEKRHACITPESKAAFRKAPYQVPCSSKRKYKKRKPLDVNLEDVQITTKRRSTLRPLDYDSPEFWEHSNQSYMCPVDCETNTEGLLYIEEQLEETVGVKKEEEEQPLSPVSFHTSGQFNHSPNNTAYQNITNMFSEDACDESDAITLKRKVWMRRAARSKQILMSSKVNDVYGRCREIGLDFNVGGGRRQSLDVQLLTNLTLYEVNKFATTMTKSLGTLFSSVLENNFKLVFQDELQQRNFFFYMITKEKLLSNHPCKDQTEFLNKCLQFPEVYNKVDVTSDLKSECDVQPESDPDPHPTAADESRETDPGSFPYCSKLGLNVWTVEPLPASKKLDLMGLTHGAVIEMVTFVRELCGTAREIVNDILEHNFDINLQDSSTEASKAIQRWFLTQKHVMKKTLGAARFSKWSDTLVIPTGVPMPVPVKIEDGPEDLDTAQVAESGELPVVKTDVKDEVPEVEFCYDICQQIGLDLDVHSKAVVKEKLDLHVLTRAALFEIHHYVKSKCNRYVPALYEILEYNFDLSSQNHRKVQFAWSIASQVLAMVDKINKRKGDYMKRVFELPFVSPEDSEITCKEEPDNGYSEPHVSDDGNEVTFVREMRPVDIEVEVE